MNDLRYFWMLHPSVQTSIRIAHPMLSEAVYGALSDYEYSLEYWLDDRVLIEELARHAFLSEEDVEIGLEELQEQGLIDYDGYAMLEVYASARDRAWEKGVDLVWPKIEGSAC